MSPARAAVRRQQRHAAGGPCLGTYGVLAALIRGDMKACSFVLHWSGSINCCLVMWMHAPLQVPFSQGHMIKLSPSTAAVLAVLAALAIRADGQARVVRMAVLCCGGWGAAAVGGWGGVGGRGGHEPLAPCFLMGHVDLCQWPGFAGPSVRHPRGGSRQVSAPAAAAATAATASYCSDCC